MEDVRGTEDWTTRKRNGVGGLRTLLLVRDALHEEAVPVRGVEVPAISVDGLDSVCAGCQHAGCGKGREDTGLRAHAEDDDAQESPYDGYTSAGK